MTLIKDYIDRKNVKKEEPVKNEENGETIKKEEPVKIEENKKNDTMTSIGLESRHIYYANRIETIKAVINRYCEKEYKIPSEWI